MKLILLIPAYNEAEHLSDVIARCPSALEDVDEIEIVVVDDGSNDSTARVAAESGARVIQHPRRRGVGVAFTSGLDAALQAGADLICQLDADGQHPPENIPQLLEPLLRGRAEFVTATRFARPQDSLGMPIKRRWGNKIVAALVRQLSGADNLTDVACGFRAFTREVALRLNLYGGFTYTQESLIDLISKNIYIHEVPMRIVPRRAGGEGKISGNLFRYALLALLIIARAVRDQRPLRFFGAIGIASTLLGIAQLGFIMIHWLNTGRTWPYTSLITGGAMCLILGVLLMVLALIADMMGRHRAISEKLLYLAKREQYRAPSKAQGGEGARSEQLTESTIR